MPCAPPPRDDSVVATGSAYPLCGSNSRERDVIDKGVRLAPLQFGGRHNFGIDADALKHRNIGAKSRRVAFVNDDGETRLDEATFPPTISLQLRK